MWWVLWYSWFTLHHVTQCVQQWLWVSRSQLSVNQTDCRSAFREATNNVINVYSLHSTSTSWYVILGVLGMPPKNYWQLQYHQTYISVINFILNCMNHMTVLWSSTSCLHIHHSDHAAMYNYMCCMQVFHSVYDQYAYFVNISDQGRHLTQTWWVTFYRKKDNYNWAVSTLTYGCLYQCQIILVNVRANSILPWHVWAIFKHLSSNIYYS